MKFLNFFLFFRVIFALLDPDPDPDSLTWLNRDPIRIRIRNTDKRIVLLLVVRLPFSVFMLVMRTWIKNWFFIVFCCRGYRTVLYRMSPLNSLELSALLLVYSSNFWEIRFRYRAYVFSVAASGCLSWTPDPGSRIPYPVSPNPGIIKATDPGSGSAALYQYVHNYVAWQCDCAIFVKDCSNFFFSIHLTLFNYLYRRPSLLHPGHW
jgi:hypothetical protein